MLTLLLCGTFMLSIHNFCTVLISIASGHLSSEYLQDWAENITSGRGWIAIALVIFATWDPSCAVLGTLLSSGINSPQFRMQSAGITIPASFPKMMPYKFAILVLVFIVWWKIFLKQNRNNYFERQLKFIITIIGIFISVR